MVVINYVLRSNGLSSLGKDSIGEAARYKNGFLEKSRQPKITAGFMKGKTGEVSLAGFVLETLFNAACPHGEQWHGLRYLTLS